jgi:hypothetical protein
MAIVDFAELRTLVPEGRLMAPSTAPMIGVATRTLRAGDAARRQARQLADLVNPAEL